MGSASLQALPAANVAEFSVSELSSALRRTLEDAYGFVRVRGEVSGFKRHSSGHCYFALKDEGACIDAVLWRSAARRLAFQPEDGLEVVASGRITTYAQRSKYQLMVEQMAPAGVGALMALLEERKRRLAAEGLFALERKRPLPFLPEVVGVVTSPTGAVIRDILHRLAERFPRRVLLWPVAVQGEQAAAQVAAAIEGFNRLPAGGAVPRPDVLIVARGGGSLEDLWAFNEEVVVRAAAASAIPLIAAVGHETDTTLIDLAADLRAPTPTAAAERAVPVRLELVQRLHGLAGRLTEGTQRDLAGRAQLVAGLARGLPQPVSLLAQAAQRLDDRAEGLPRAMDGLLERRRWQVAELASRLRSPAQLLQDATHRLHRPADRLAWLLESTLRDHARQVARFAARLRVDGIADRLPRHRSALGDLAARQERAIGRQLGDVGQRVRTLASLLEGLSYQGTLARGFALVRGERGLVRSAAVARAEPVLELEFADGRMRALPEDPARRRPQRARREAAPAEQGRLL
jgi:exodeoxyribonuclease VII large subunit